MFFSRIAIYGYVFLATLHVATSQTNLTDEGFFTSPNYPNDYMNNLDISWVIRLPLENAKVNLRFTNFVTESSNDFVQVRDGDSITSPLLRTITGTQNNIPIVYATGNTMYIRFKTDTSVVHSGWRAEFNVQQITYNYTGSDANYVSIKSPNFPDPSWTHIIRTWVIELPEPTEGNLRFENFRLNSGDQLEIRNGSQATSPLIAILTGDRMPPIYFMPNGARLRFVSLSATASPGFFAKFAAPIPNTTITDDGALFASPFYPGNYPPQILPDLLYTVDFTQYGPNAVVAFTFLDLSTLNGVTIFDGDSEFSPVLGIFTNEINLSVISTGNKMTLSLRPQGQLGHKGFQGQVHQIQTNQLISTHNATFTTPLHPKNYPRGTDMVWMVDLSSYGPNGTANLEFFDFRTLNVNDIVEVRDGESDTSPLLGSFFGQNKPPLLFSSGPNLRVRFTSDNLSFTQAPGFLARVCHVNPIVGTVTTDGAVIASPGYPENYASNLDVIWIIDFSQYGPGVSINLTSIEFETFDNMDTVRVHDGATEEGTLLGTFFGNSPVRITSTSPVINLRFTTNCLAERGVFQIRADLIKAGPEYITEDQAVIHSPNYPDNYPANLIKVWIVDFTQYGPDILIFLDFSDFQTNGGRDFVEIRDGDTETGFLLGRFSGSTLPPSVSSAGNKMRIEFSTTEAPTARGFQAKLSKIDVGRRI